MTPREREALRELVEDLREFGCAFALLSLTLAVGGAQWTWHASRMLAEKWRAGRG